MNFSENIPSKLDLCYTFTMDIDDRHIWQLWAEFLHRWGLGDWAASFLEAVGPLTIVGAQVVAVTQPFLTQSRTGSHLAALSKMLESTGSTQAFVDYLREARMQ